MAEIPELLEEAVDALMAKVVAEEPTAKTVWELEDADPTTTVEASEYATPSQSLYQFCVLDLETDAVRTFGSPRVRQRARLAIRTNLYERDPASLGRSLVRHVRKVQNWIEELDNNGRHRAARKWWIDWKRWESIRDESGRAPTPGARILCDVVLTQ